MPNICDTTCTITGPDAEIERFRQTCFPIDGGGLDFSRAASEWEEDFRIFKSAYNFRDGQHQLWMETAWEPPLRTLKKLSALFPPLTFDVFTADEFYSFLGRGLIKAGVADLYNDAEEARTAAQDLYDALMGAERSRS